MAQAVTGFQNILLGGNDLAWQGEMQQWFRTIANTGLGHALLTAINVNPQHNRLYIGKAGPGGSNITQLYGLAQITDVHKPFVRLRTLFILFEESSRRQQEKAAVAAEMDSTLQDAAAQGESLRSIARKLARYTSIGALGTSKQGNLDMLSGLKAKRSTTNAYEQLLTDMRDPNVVWTMPPDSLKPGSGAYSLGDMILRVLQFHLNPGPGHGAVITFNKDLDSSCVAGGQMRKRPPIIGLFHELVHGWRNVAGLRIYDDFMSCNLPDDELMTTGLPPYDQCRFSENEFRAVVQVEERSGYR